MDNGITFYNEKNAIKFMNSLIKEGIDFDYRYDEGATTEYTVYILNDDEEDEEENE